MGASLRTIDEHLPNLHRRFEIDIKPVGSYLRVLEGESGADLREVHNYQITEDQARWLNNNLVSVSVGGTQSPDVTFMARLMQGRLQHGAEKFGDVHGWKRMSVDEARRRVTEELAVLDQTIAGGSDPIAVAIRCADVMNYLTFLSWLYGNQ